MEQETELSELDKRREKIFFIHSRNSSISSMIGEEDSTMLLQAEKRPVPTTSTKSQEAEVSGDSSGGRRCGLSASGRCVCKISLMLYLATCITVSALYVAFFGKNQAFFGDAWIPGKVRKINKRSIETSLAVYF